MLTPEQFGSAYDNGFTRTVRLLVSRGASHDDAVELAQTAWARGWEKRGQWRQDSPLDGWINAIAINMHRTTLRRFQPIFSCTLDESAIVSPAVEHRILARQASAMQRNRPPSHLRTLLLGML